MNDSNDVEGPTLCDIAQVKNAYNELRIRVNPAAMNMGVDDGEEPIEDDTPLVRPH
jgi:hypothetical protein